MESQLDHVYHDYQADDESKGRGGNSVGLVVNSVDKEADEVLEGYIDEQACDEEYHSLVLISHRVIFDAFVLQLHNANFQFFLGLLLFLGVFGRQKENSALAEKEEVRVFELEEMESTDDEQK